MKTNSLTRRTTLLNAFGGASVLALRSLATGLPMWFLANPRKALAQTLPACGTQSKAQFLILSTSAAGDPINANVPGCYGDPAIKHSADPQMAATGLRLGSQQVTAAKPWASLPQAVLDRTSFWHLMTRTPVHPDEPDVLKLMGAIRPSEMFPSALSKHLALCLGTVQPQPITVGAQNPSEGLSYDGGALPILPPVALRDTLLSKAGPITTLQPLRDQTLNEIAGILKQGSTPAQRQYVDSLLHSQELVRNIPQNLLSALSAINNNSIDAQITAAVTLIKMKVSPVIVLKFDFGGDNHNDTGLVRETAQTVASVAGIANMLQQLKNEGLEDQVSFLSLNVFGRTLGVPASGNGRNHNANHQVSIAIGKPFKPGVIGGVAPVGRDYGAVTINSSTGAPSSSGDVPPTDTLASFGKSVMAAVGIAQPTIDSLIPGGKVIRGGLA